MRDIGNCAATGTPESAGWNPQACWEHCKNYCINWAKTGPKCINWAAIVWKNGTCGCVSSGGVGTCASGNKDDYEYYESSPSACQTGKPTYFVTF